MLLVFLVSIDIKADTDSIAGKRSAENSSILCSSNDGVILTQGIRFAKTSSAVDDLTISSLEAASMSAARG